MAKSEADRRARALYNKRTYERLYFELRRDAALTGEVIRRHAAAMGESKNAFIKRAITETIQRDLERMK